MGFDSGERGREAGSEGRREGNRLRGGTRKGDVKSFGDMQRKREREGRMLARGESEESRHMVLRPWLLLTGGCVKAPASTGRCQSCTASVLVPAKTSCEIYFPPLFDQEFQRQIVFFLFTAWSYIFSVCTARVFIWPPDSIARAPLNRMKRKLRRSKRREREGERESGEMASQC